MDGGIFASISTTLAKYVSKRVFPIKLALKFALHTVWTHSLGMTTKLKKTTNQLELTVNWYFTLKNRLMGLPSFLLVHMWVGLNSADLRDRRQTRSRNSGAYSPPQCSQWFVIWPFNICCKLTDLCTAKKKKKRHLQNVVFCSLAAKTDFFFLPMTVYSQRGRNLRQCCGFVILTFAISSSSKVTASTNQFPSFLFPFSVSPSVSQTPS